MRFLFYITCLIGMSFMFYTNKKDHPVVIKSEPRSTEKGTVTASGGGFVDTIPGVSISDNQDTDLNVKGIEKWILRLTKAGGEISIRMKDPETGAVFLVRRVK